MNGTDNPNPRAPAVWGSIWTLFGIAAFTVVLRFKARNIRRLPWEMDDYAVLVALFFTFGTCISSSLGARFGVGKHIQNVSEADQEKWNKSLFYGNLVYVSTGPSIKIAALLMYQRVFAIPRFRLVVRVLCGVCFAWYVAETIGSIWNCVPINGFWNKSIHAKCISTHDFDLQYAVINISLDVIVLALPIRMVLGLQLSNPQKAGFVLLFLMGGFATVAAIVRFIVFIRVLSNPDTTYVWYEGVIWSAFEPSIGVISICLPLLRPVILAALPLRLRSSFVSKGERFFASSGKSGHVGVLSSRSRNKQGEAAVRHQHFLRLHGDDILLGPLGGDDERHPHSEARADGSEVAERAEDKEQGDMNTILRRTDIELQVKSGKR